MNPLTQIRNTQKITQQEIAAGYTDAQSWHARYKHSAYIYAGGLGFGLTEGDLLAVFSQYGEIVDVNLVRNTETGKSRGFAFLAYEDQRSTNLAVDNLNGAKVAGRIITVDHVDNYKRKIAEVEGRGVSDSEEEEEAAVRADDAEAAAIADAVGDGAQFVATNEARSVGDGAAGPGSTDGGAGGDEPWASKTSVYALLNSGMPVPTPSRPEIKEDPLLQMKKQKKMKKEKKTKEKKGQKSRRHETDDSAPSWEPSAVEPSGKEMSPMRQLGQSRADRDERRRDYSERHERPEKRQMDTDVRGRSDRHRDDGARRDEHRNRRDDKDTARQRRDDRDSDRRRR